ncbi:BMC domain-containing protein [Marinifilum sp. JC120]|nr:BMC domain-containing protein [Marinifilum sp. JC120]
MNLRTIGCVELNSVALGIHTADEMLKAAQVELVMARPTCPGRYIVVVTGDTGSVKSSVEVGCEIGADMVVDHFTIASVHEDVIPALSGTSIVPQIDALGVIETYTIASCILAADAAAKSADVSLIEIRMAAGLGGKAYVTMTGDVGSVSASVEAGVEGVGESGPVHSHVVIPSPSEGIKEQLI